MWTIEEREILRSINISGFPGGSVVKNPPANAGDMASILIQEDPTYWGATQPVRLSYWTCALEPGSCKYWSPHTLEPVLPAREAYALQLESRPCSLQLEKSPSSSEDPARPKIININEIIYIIYNNNI